VIDYSVLPLSKGPTRKTLKRRRAASETAVKRQVRAIVVERDGYCRFLRGHETYMGCDGPSEWAHWGDRKRFKTRGEAPELRHTTAGSLMLCRCHHRLYDSGALTIEADTERGCDGPLTYRWR
jgi:hypothetical protein